MKEGLTGRHGERETRGLRDFLRIVIAIAMVVMGTSACALRASRQGVPPEVESVVTTVGEDAEEGRYEKIYSEADEEWRRDSTLEQTAAVFGTVKTKLGNVKTRQLHGAAEENRSNGRLAGHSFVLTYDTKFDRGEGMETFTLVERNGRWLLAKYFVNSTALQ
ncbi:MAG: hypothetical protein JWM21_2373 [Acidobacteria bacterium]|nr:hypothetical protein [Acidobacteriota bacterium]